MTQPTRPPYYRSLALVLLGGALALAGCNEKRVDKVPGGSPTATPQTSERSATQQAADRAAAAAQKLNDAQNSATTDEQKAEAVRQYEAERQSIANGTDQPQSSNGDSAPPPN